MSFVGGGEDCGSCYNIGVKRDEGEEIDSV